MLRLRRIVFEYEDGSMEEIFEPKAAALFQSRCNSSGILSGFGDWIVPLTEDNENAEPAS